MLGIDKGLSSSRVLSSVVHMQHTECSVTEVAPQAACAYACLIGLTVMWDGRALQIFRLHVL